MTETNTRNHATYMNQENTLTNRQSQLPIKKRIFNNADKTYKGPESFDKACPWQPWKENTGNTVKTPIPQLPNSEVKDAKIVPGVIRHTSHPNHSLACYYHY